MERFYHKLYNLRVEHGFYSDLESSDLAFAPIADTLNILRTHGIIFKENGKGFDLVYKALNLAGDPIIPIDDKRVLRFGMSLRNSNALYFTNFPAKSADTDIYYAYSDYSQANLILECVSTRQPAFTENYTFDFPKATFRILDEDGFKRYETILEVEESEEVSDDFVFSFSVNLGSNFKQGLHTLQILQNGILKESQEVYIFNRFQYPDLIGVVELELNEEIEYTSLPYTAAVQLVASSSVWRYEVEITRNLGDGSIEIIDTENGPISFNEITGITDYLKGETLIFESTDAITKSEKPYTNFNLEVTTDDHEIVLTGLPNPSHHNAKSIIYLKL